MHSHATLIIEDRKHIAVLLQKAVTATPGLKYAGTAATLLQGLRLLSEQRPRIVLVDLGLPDGSGLCLETGGNSLAAVSEHVDLGLIRPRGQG